jgi:DNA-binding NtrC family response regulator
MPRRVLSISYDPILLSIRQQLLEQNGYTVVSAEGFTEAMERCRGGEYDMVVMGHSIPHKDKEALFDAVTRHCKVPVLCLMRTGEPPLAGVAASIDPMSPSDFLKAVQDIFARKANA